ncbi:hypothetical protein, partial [Sulfurovum sp.]|uniref:hypothetical protein n=1 Tax=Sulfurovum sp. TaxID=1969726 RepID=UPI00261D41FA
DEMILPFVQSGEIASRAEMIDKLREIGLELGDNPGKRKYIPIIDPNNPDKVHRLKGEIYAPDFSGLPDLKKKIEADAVKQGYGRPLEEIEADLQRFIDRDAEYNKNRYQYKGNENDRTTTDYPGKESRAIRQRGAYKRAISEHNSRIEELDRVREQSISRVAAVAEATAANTNREPARADSIDRGEQIDNLINSTERRIETDLDFTEQDYRAIREARRDSQLRRSIKGSIATSIQQLADEFVRGVKQATERLKEAFKKKEEPKIKSVLSDLPDTDDFISPTFTPQKP